MMGAKERRMSAAERLSHLLELADQGPALRAALAEEVAELLADWPSDYPETMRGACEALLTKAARDLDAPTRARLRVRLYADPALFARVLPREPGAQALIAAARKGEQLTPLLAGFLGVDIHVAGDILSDESGFSLAIAAKGAGLDRAAFSALALLTHPGGENASARAMLDSYDAIGAAEAARRLRTWRESFSHAAE
jgi:hypothetical protein